ncbi:MAG: hypothetical protein JOY86_01335 [Candidatus Eremiobacteraeota bacterium]|nr:hypothetical protein [Candidatus Eremiobacteraeota bacterium]
MRFGLMLALAAALAAFPACAKNSAPQTAPGTTTEQSPTSSVQQATIQMPQGKVQMGQGAVDPNTLGLPVYPGATPSQAGSFSVSGAQGGGTQIVTIVTKDPFDKVVAFYKAKMPAGTQEVQTGSGATAKAQFVAGKASDAEHKNVIIAPSGDAVNITLIVGSTK